MNDEKIVKHLIEFVENKERQLQINKMLNDTQGRSDVVKSILNELESELANEDNKD